MYILALDTSAKAASCAVSVDGLLLCESFLNAGLTHSVTVMPMVEEMLSCVGVKIDDIGLFAVSAGPGSFTGLRIGVSAVKGMAFATGKPCAAVSTLEALAFNAAAFRGVIVPAMDARRNQVYTASFRGGSRPVRIARDDALSIPELAERLASYAEPAMLVGDGAELVFNAVRDRVGDISLAPPALLHQRASSVCAVAAGITEYKSAGELEPTYLRMPQAERERRQRESL